MSEFHIVAFEFEYPSFSMGPYATLELAQAKLAEMVDSTYEADGKTYPVYHDDTLIIINDEFKVVDIWSGKTEKTADDFADCDIAGYLNAQKKRKGRVLIGFQITDLSGQNVQGTGEDPFDLSKDDVLTGQAVLTAKGWATDRDYLVREVFNDDLEQPKFVSEISLVDLEPGLS